MYQTRQYSSELPPQYSPASMRAAMSLQNSLTEVEWSACSFSGKSDIGVTVLVCFVWYVHGVWWETHLWK